VRTRDDLSSNESGIGDLARARRAEKRALDHDAAWTTADVATTVPLKPVHQPRGGPLDWIPLITAGIGALSGSIAGPYLKDFLDQRRSRASLRDLLVHQYLLQLQLDSESLYFRLRNILYQSGRGAMESMEYFETSMLYGFGALLAHKLLFQADGVYSRITELDTTKGSALLSAMEAIDGDIADLGKRAHPVPAADDAPEGSRSAPVASRPEGRFQRYSRLALAQAVLAPKGDSWRVRTYPEFVNALNEPDSRLRESLASALAVVELVGDDPQTDASLRKLEGDLLRLGGLLEPWTRLSFPLFK
jgi:hypothetical protein